MNNPIDPIEKMKQGVIDMNKEIAIMKARIEKMKKAFKAR
jgi:hypothetical protein